MTDFYLERRILNGAIRNLNSYGWRRGSYGEPNKKMCVLGACVHSMNELATTGKNPGTFIISRNLAKSMLNVIELLCSIVNQCAAVWNDNDCSGKKEAIKLLLSAADTLEAKQ